MSATRTRVRIASVAAAVTVAVGFAQPAFAADGQGVVRPLAERFECSAYVPNGPVDIQACIDYIPGNQYVTHWTTVLNPQDRAESGTAYVWRSINNSSWGGACNTAGFNLSPGAEMQVFCRSLANSGLEFNTKAGSSFGGDEPTSGNIPA
jgi:hypothetical protein